MPNIWHSNINIGRLIAENPFQEREISIGSIVYLKPLSSNSEILHAYNIKTWDLALAKVLELSPAQQRIKKIQWLNQPEKEVSLAISRFGMANSEFVENFRIWTEHPPLTDLPAIGTVLIHNGTGDNGEIAGLMVVVVAHAQHRILVEPLNNMFPVLSSSIERFYVSPNQSQARIYNIVQCSQCGSQRAQEHSVCYERNYYCDHSCAQRAGWFNCSDCNAFIASFRDEIRRVNRQGRIVCCDCLENYSECPNCSGFCNSENMLEQDYGRPRVCPDCYNRLNRLILEHSFKPEPIFNKMVWENTRYVGIELEIEVEEGADRSLLAKGIKQWLKGRSLGHLVYLKEDGSLSNGFEIVFHPFTLKSIHKTFPMKDFLKFLKDNGAMSYESGHCGHHVHVSKADLTNHDLLKTKWFFVKCGSFIARFSGRSDFSYCKFDTNFPGRNDPYNQPHGKYSAFNVAASMETVEFRVFRGTLDYFKFMANIQFSEATIEFIQHIGAAFLKTKNHAEIWQEFIDYNKRTNQYKILTDYILQHAIV